MSDTKDAGFGVGDNSFRAAGGQTGITKLVDRFYTVMGTDPRFTTIYQMHPSDISTSRDKLTRFLCGWLGGPKLYHEKYGAISIPGVHAHLPITDTERNLWLTCMKEAIDVQPYRLEFKSYLIEQLAVPAEAVRRRCMQDLND